MNFKPSWGFFVVAILIYFPLFGHLDKLPLLEWDEARLAMNSYEMLQKPGNILVTTFGNIPDMWNTKPPLLIWLQVLSMKSLGVNELALRLPSALAAACLCFFLYWLLAFKARKPWLGIISCVVLVTSEGYVSTHGTRTADYDSLLTLFTTLYCGFFFLYLEEKKARYVYLAFFSMALAVLTKGVAGILFTPALLLYFCMRRQHFTVFKSPHLYLSAIIFLIVAGGYYLLREHYNPGYLNAVQENELGGRFTKVNDQHTGEWDYYLQYMLSWRFNYWIFTLPLGIYAGLRSWDSRTKRLTVLSAVLSLVFFTIISTAKTKLDWYDMPMYPWLSVIVGIFIFAVFKVLLTTWRRIYSKTDILPVLFLFFAFILPYRNIYYSVTDPRLDPWTIENMNMGYLFKDARDNKINIEGNYVVWDDLAPNLDWYLKAFNDLYKVQHRRSDQIPFAKPRDKIIIYKSATRAHVEALYKNLTPVGDYKSVIFYEVK